MKIKLKRGSGAPNVARQLGNKVERESEPDFLVLSEAAEYMRVSTATLYKLALARKVPCTRVGRKYIFSRDRLAEWLSANIDAEYAMSSTPSAR